MLISCPKCHFKRHVDEKQIPESATLATCPKCQNKFRFRDPETGEFIAEICLEREQKEQAEHLDRTPKTAEHQEVSAHAPANAETTEPTENTEQAAEQTHAQPAERAAKKAAEQITGQETKKEQTPPAEDPIPLSEEQFTRKKQKEENPLQEPEYQAYAEKKAERYVMMTDDVPWEHPERYGFIRSFFRTIVRVMFSGKEFFSTIHSQVSSLRPASFYAIIGLIQALIGYLSSPSMVNFIKNANIDPQQQVLMENLFSGQSLTMLIITTPFIMILQLLIYASFVYLAIRITNPEKADFPLTLRIIAYASAPMILCIVPYLGGFIGLVWFIYNIFIGVKYALRLPWQRTFLALAPIFILWFFIAFNQAMVILSAIQG